MVREDNIIKKARITLNDTNEDLYRWSNERLMSLLNEAQNDMCRNIPMIVNRASINTVDGQEEYKLPYGSIKLITAFSDKIPLQLVSYDEIERSYPEWETDSADSYTAIIVNALSQRVIRPYPICGNKMIKIRYQSMPIQLGWDELTNDIKEELAIDDMWDMGLKQYVIAYAFLDYGDESSISRAQLALGLYGKEFKRAENLARKSFSKRNPTTGYQARVSSRKLGGQYGCSTRYNY